MYGRGHHQNGATTELSWQTPPEEYLAEEEARIQAMELEWQQREADEQPVCLEWDLGGVVILGQPGVWTILRQQDEYTPLTLARGLAVREYAILAHQDGQRCTAQLVRTYQR